MAESSLYPTALDSSNIYEVVARLSTTLTADIDGTTTTIPLASTTGFPTQGYIVIDNETIKYVSVSVGSVDATAGRGHAGTAASHTSGTQVLVAVTAAVFNKLRAGLIAMQTHAGTSGTQGWINARWLGGSTEGQLNVGYLGGSTESQLNVDTTQTLANKTLTKPVINGTNPTGATYTPDSGAQVVALDCAANNMHIVTGHADGTAITFTVANATNNQPFIVSILQGAVVSTIAAWFDTVRWPGGVTPTLTATVGKRDTFGFIRTGANTYDGFIVGQNL